MLTIRQTCQKVIKSDEQKQFKDFNLYSLYEWHKEKEVTFYWELRRQLIQKKFTIHLNIMNTKSLHHIN